MRKSSSAPIIIVFLVIILFIFIFIQFQTSQKKMFVTNSYMFSYVADFIIKNEASSIRRDAHSKQIIEVGFRGSSPQILEDINDELFVDYVRFLFDECRFDRIAKRTTHKTNVAQILFYKNTYKRDYAKGIAFCEDNEPPEKGVFYRVRRIQDYWFSYEEDLGGGMNLGG